MWYQRCQERYSVRFQEPHAVEAIGIKPLAIYGDRAYWSVKQSVELAKKGIILISIPKKNAKRFQGSFKGILALMKKMKYSWKYVIMYHMRARIEYFIGRVKKYERELGSYMLAILKQNLIALKDKKST